MFRSIHETDRCKLFEQIAETVWNKIIRAHDVKTNLKEIGITAEIIVEILHFNKNGNNNFEIYAKDSYDEDTYGSDMDVFIETDKNKYRWFALQAKILKKNNVYSNLRHCGKDGVMQWEKLKLLEGLSGCTAYYLLYNGRNSLKLNEKDRCQRSFSESQYGCSLVKPQIIEKFANIMNSGNTKFKYPKFEDFHPKHAQPWRILNCCYHQKEDFQLYSIQDIIKSEPLFRPIEQVGLDEGEVINSRENDEGIEDSNNLIRIASRESGWNPELRIIISRTNIEMNKS